MEVQQLFIFPHELQHLFFKGLSPFLTLIFIFALSLLLMLEPWWSIPLLKVLPMSWDVLCSSTIREILMVPECWGIMGWQVGVLLEMICSLLVQVVGLLHFIGNLINAPLSIIYASFVFPLLQFRVHSAFFYPPDASMHTAWPLWQTSCSAQSFHFL